MEAHNKLRSFQMRLPVTRAIPFLLGAAILLPVAACDEGGEVDATEGDAVIVTPEADAEVETDG